MRLLNLILLKLGEEGSFRNFRKRFQDYESTSLIDELRARDFGRLDRQNHTYLDFTGGQLYPESLVDWHNRFLKAHILGNPHSQNPSSALSGSFIASTRRKILDFFNCQDDYLCIFTSNASAAIKLIGESYPFEPESRLLLTMDNHNSVNGLREYVRGRSAQFHYSSLNQEMLTLNEDDLLAQLRNCDPSKNNLLAYPAQSNVSGLQHDLKWISIAHDLGWDVMLDAAASVPSSRLDLQEYQPDFVPISFYKMFGYPTGLGCLLVKKSSFSKMQKPAFAGGTITIVSVLGDGYYLDTDEARFEDGTVDYLSIPAVGQGLEYLEKIGFDRMKKRINSLLNYLIEELQTLEHSNGKKLLRIYGSTSENHGGTIALNFFDRNGEMHDFLTIEKKASDWNISLRTGCFCNPGIDETNHKLSASDLKSYFEQEGEKDYFNLIEYLGKRRGAVRISLSWITNFRDVYRFIQFCKTFLNKGCA